MTDTKGWTAGEWKADGTYVFAGSNCIALCDTANASLIAAAPDLYEALADLIPRFETACRLAGSGKEFIAIATAPHRAALAKAQQS